MRTLSRIPFEGLDPYGDAQIFDPGTLIGADGDPVGSFKNTAATIELTAIGAARPTISIGDFGDTPALEFDGNQHLDNVSRTYPGTNTSFTFGILVQSTAVASTPVPVTHGGSDAYFWQVLAGATNAWSLGTAHLTFNRNDTPSLPFPRSKIAALIATYDGANTKIYAMGLATSVAATGNLAISNAMYLGQLANTTLRYVGRMGICFDSPHVYTPAQVVSASRSLLSARNINFSQILCNGDSILAGQVNTAGFDPLNLTLVALGARAAYWWNWKNAAGGTWISGVLAQANASTINQVTTVADSNWLFLNGGANDINGGNSAATALADTRAMCDNIKAAMPLAKILLLPIIASGVTVPKQAIMDAANVLISNQYSTWGSVHAYSASMLSDVRLCGPNAHADYPALWFDYAHPNDAGSAVMAAHMAAMIP